MSTVYMREAAVDREPRAFESIREYTLSYTSAPEATPEAAEMGQRREEW